MPRSLPTARVAPGVLLGALPHGVEDVKSLQAEDGGPSVKCFVTMNEMEMRGKAYDHRG